MKKRKIAVFVHGWSKQGNQWKQRKRRLLSLLESFGYYIAPPLDMPKGYMLPKKGFDYYAKYIATEIEKIEKASSCPCCHQNWPINEIVLIAHSMGGVACRLYLQDDKIGDVGIKRKITKLITLASPHHGTSVAIEDFMEEILNLPEMELLHWSKCYKQLSPGSDFIRKLNTLAFPSTTTSYSIWSRGDKVVTPTHTAVLDSANNCFIDNLGVGHIGVMHSVYTSDIVRDILNGKVNPKGLQRYPEKCNCDSDKKQWIPVFYYSEKPDEGYKSLKKSYLWKCKNTFEGNTCDAEYSQEWMPRSLGCKIGRMKERLHTWRKTGLKHWVCKKCGAAKTGKKHPKIYDYKGCVGLFKNRHRWELVYNEWKCTNTDDETGKVCETTINSKWRPPLLGCSVGKIVGDIRLHDWYRKDKRYWFKFKCSGCGKIVTLRE